MKKNLLFAIAGLLFFLGGCDSNLDSINPPIESIESAVLITVKDHNEVAVIKEFDLKVDTTIFEVMDKKFDIETDEEGKIISIDGHAEPEDGSEKWVFEVNGESSDEVRSKTYVLQDGDVVYWELK